MTQQSSGWQTKLPPRVWARRELAVPVGVAALAVLALVVTYLPLGSFVRPPVVLAFFLLGPGLAVVPLLGIGDRVMWITFVVAVSVAVDLVAALVMLYGGVWSPDLALVALILLSLAGAVAQLVAARNRPSDRALGAHAPLAPAGPAPTDASHSPDRSNDRPASRTFRSRVNRPTDASSEHERGEIA
ncbi:MAG: hypothetical protein GEU73_15845 [Chloroflexi bacterium]|nr:hypothetical protein [Chloroflexota bacterium]